MRKLLLLALFVAAACGNKKKEDKPAEASQDGAAPKVDKTGKDGGAAAVTRTDGGGAAVAKTDGGPPAKRVALVERAQLDALMTTWLESQNSGDFAAYSALYADDFKGVRRSGKQTVRLERAGWLKERKHMFARPMIVAARDVEVVLAAGRATAKFSQEWSSGKYHDVGPKVIEVIADGNALKIAREELLASRIVKPPKPTAVDEDLPPVFLMLGDVMVVSGIVDADWATGEPKLESDVEVPERDPSCDDDPPDYEAEQERYWECDASDPDRAYDDFSASQQIALGMLPKAFVSLIGEQVQVHEAGGGICKATVDHLELFAETQTTYSTLTRAGDNDAAIAASVLGDATILIAVLTGDCRGPWAQLTSASVDTTEWAIGGATPELEKAMKAELKDAGLDAYELDGLDYRMATQPFGKTTLAFATRGSEECFGQSAMTMVFVVRGKKVGAAIFDESDQGELVAVVETGADGLPALVFSDGIATAAGDEPYSRELTVDFPDEIEQECGE